MRGTYKSRKFHVPRSYSEEVDVLPTHCVIIIIIIGNRVDGGQAWGEAKRGSFVKNVVLRL